MKHLFNKLSAFLVMLMCVSATVQAEIVHHEVCDPTATSRGFNVECWENTVTNKFYTNEACTQELTGAELAKAVVYAKLPSNPISDNSEFDVVEFDNTQTWGVNLNWAAETTFSNAYTAWSSTPRYAEFTVAGDNVEDARLVWMKNQGAIEQGKYTIKIYVNGIVKTSIVQNETLEGVYVQSLPGLKDGDVVKFEVAQNAQASYNTANPTFKACLEYTSGIYRRIIHHTPCEPTLSTLGFKFECWENTETGKFYSDTGCTQELKDADLARTVVYAKLPESPITKLLYFDGSEHENDWSVDLNWAAKTTFEETNYYLHYRRYAEFTVKDDIASNARLVWNRDQGDVINGRFEVRITVNDNEIYYINQNNREYIEGVFVQTLSELKYGDVVRFDVNQNGYGQSNEAAPTFKACLEYLGHNHTYSNGWCVCTCGYIKEHNHSYANNTCTLCGLIHHVVTEPTVSSPGFTRECWEQVGKFYSDEACTQELKDTDLAKAVIYAKLPESPISNMSEFHQSEHENDWSVDFNWAAVTTFSNAYSGWSSTPRYAEFTATRDDITNARLVWNRNEMSTENGKYTVSIYVNDKKIFSRNQNGGEEFEGVFVQPLPGLKKGDIVKFEVTQNAAASASVAKPTFKACLEYVAHTHTYSDGWCVCSCGYIKDHSHRYENNTCTLCGLIHHVVTEPTVSSRGFTRECWEQVGKFYSDEACTQELKDTDLAKAVIYAKLPESPISNMSEFHQSEHENDWSVDFNWAAVTTFSNAYSGWLTTPRYAEFTATRDDITNARLVWNRNEMATVNGKYIVIIYVNGKEIFSRNQNGGEEFEGVFVQPLPGLKKGDIVKFEVTQYAGASASAAKPSFKACLEYNMPEIAITANENPDEPGAYYSTFYDGQKAYTLSDGATAYTGTISDDNLLLTPIEDGIIPKGEAVIIRSNSGNITLLPSNSTKKKNEDNRLRGSDTDTEAPDGCYILSYGQHSLGFYRYAEGSILAAHKAFLIIQHGALAKAFRMVFADGEADGIEKVSVNDTENSVIYNLNGVRLDKLQKGINIVNGKKIVVK